MQPDIIVVAVLILSSVPLKNIEEYLINLGIPSIAVKSIIVEMEIEQLTENLKNEISGAVYISTRNLNASFKTKSQIHKGKGPFLNMDRGKVPKGWIFQKHFAEVNRFEEAMAQAALLGSKTYKNVKTNRGTPFP